MPAGRGTCCASVARTCIRRETIGSEMAWLAALAADTSMRVPAPVPARDGSLVVAATPPGRPRGAPVRAVALGRRAVSQSRPDAGASGAHRRRARPTCRSTPRGWTPPPGFVRPRVDTLTTAAKRASLGGPAAAPGAGPWPIVADGERATALVSGARLGSPMRGVVGDAIELVRSTTTALAARPDAAGLDPRRPPPGERAVRRRRPLGLSTSTTAAGASSCTTSPCRCPRSSLRAGLPGDAERPARGLRAPSTAAR